VDEATSPFLFTKKRLRSSQEKAILAFNVATHCQACWLERMRSLIHYVKRGASVLDEAPKGGSLSLSFCVGA